MALMSGHSGTYIYGTLGSLVEIRAFGRRYKLCLVGGDDQNLLGPDVQYKTVDNLVEIDQDDLRHRFVSGICYITATQVGFAGGKDAKDRAYAGTGFGLDGDGRWEFSSPEKIIPEREVLGWTGGYHNRAPNGRPLLEVLRGMPAGPIHRDAIEAYLESQSEPEDVVF